MELKSRREVTKGERLNIEQGGDVEVEDQLQPEWRQCTRHVLCGSARLSDFLIWLFSHTGSYCISDFSSSTEQAAPQAGPGLSVSCPVTAET